MPVSEFPDLPEQGSKWVKLRASKEFITAVVTLAAFTDNFLYGLIVPVTPTALERRAGTAPEDVQQWVSFLLAIEAFAWLVTSPAAGYIADRIESRRTPLLAGLPALIVSTTLLYIGNSLTLWVVGRILMGISAAVTWTVGLALLVDTVNKDRLGETLGYMSMGMMIGTTSGPLLGGIIYEAGGYHSVFAAAFVLILIDTVLRFAMLEKKDALQKLGNVKDIFEDMLPSAPLLGSSTSSSVPNYGMAAENTIPGEQVAANGATDLPQPSSPPILTLLSIRQIRICLWAYCIISMSLTSFDSALPLFVRDTFSWSQLGQGLIFLPISITQVIDPVAGMVCDKYPKGRRYIAAGAFVCAGAAFLIGTFCFVLGAMMTLASHR